MLNIIIWRNYHGSSVQKLEPESASSSIFSSHIGYVSEKFGC